MTRQRKPKQNDDKRMGESNSDVNMKKTVKDKEMNALKTTLKNKLLNMRLLKFKKKEPFATYTGHARSPTIKTFMMTSLEINLKTNSKLWK